MSLSNYYVYQAFRTNKLVNKLSVYKLQLFYKTILNSGDENLWINLVLEE